MKQDYHTLTAHKVMQMHWRFKGLKVPGFSTMLSMLSIKLTVPDINVCGQREILYSQGLEVGVMNA